MRAGIVGIVGGNGHGKTLGAMQLAVVPALLAGRPVCSSVPLRPAAIGADPGLYVPLRSWADIGRLGVHWQEDDDGVPVLNDEGGRIPRRADDGSLYSLSANLPCLLVLDEVNALMPARQTLDMPADLQRLLHQFRKPKVKVVWTSVAWARADKQLREATQVAVTSEGSWEDRWLRMPDGSIARNADGRRLRRDPEDWPSFRRFMWTFYDALAFDEFTLDTTRMVQALGTQSFFRRRRSAAAAVYDTTAQVHLLDWVHNGECVNCGGRKTRPVCKCSVGPLPAKRSGRAAA